MREIVLFRFVTRLVLFVFGVVFLGISIHAGFDPQRALAGCALIYISKAP